MRKLRLTAEQAQRNPCPVIHQDETFDYIDADSECWRKARERPSPKREERRTVPMAVSGPAMWAQLHIFALRSCCEKTARPWLEVFAGRIPCTECRSHWPGILRDIPPDFADLFAWSVKAHNAVNRLLGKPEMSIEAAREQWGKYAPIAPYKCGRE